LHTVSPCTLQATLHVPPEQFVEALGTAVVHAWPHIPQLPLSAWRSTHATVAVPHAVSV
jgi:hypothetical protein